MNILPKKNWHVRTRKNIDKVRKDEAKAAEEERKLNERIALAEREARTDLLRSRAKAEPSSSHSEPQSSHVDLFADSQLGRGDQRVNLEHEKEEKQKREKWEQQVGILTYLHKAQSDVDHPWYLQPHEERLLGNPISSSSLRSSKDDEAKDMHDPLKTMRQYLSKMKSSESANNSELSRKRSASKSDDQTIKKEKFSPEDKLALLRRQRIEREKKERARAEKLNARNRVTSRPPTQFSSASTPRTTDERKLRFHSQFNPHLARH